MSYTLYSAFCGVQGTLWATRRLQSGSASNRTAGLFAANVIRVQAISISSELCEQEYQGSDCGAGLQVRHGMRSWTIRFETVAIRTTCVLRAIASQSEEPALDTTVEMGC